MIKKAIYDFFENESKNKEYIEQKEINFAPSYVSSCKRQIFYKKLKITPSNPIEIHSYIKFALGDATHEKIQSILQKIGLWQEGENWKDIEWQGLKWVYRIDAKLKINDDLYICELKSSYYSGNKAVEHEAKEDHILQLFLYMIFENIERGILLYIGRDNGLMYEYHFNLESLKERYRDFFSKKIKELKILKNQIENNQLPDRDFQIVLKNNNGNLTNFFQKDNIKYKSNWQCSYCQWKSLCWGDVISKMKDYSYYIGGEFIK